MSAAVIAFPVRRGRPASGPNDYAFLEKEARRFIIEQRIRETLATETPDKKTPDNGKELLALLRRIDRRLAKMAGAEGLARQERSRQ